MEPVRSLLIPMFDTIKKEAIAAGALGVGISGSGPSIFALSKGQATADNVAEAMAGVYHDTDLDFEVHVSGICSTGVKPI